MLKRSVFMRSIQQKLKDLIIDFKNWHRLKMMPDHLFVKSVFELHLGYPLNLKKPETLNEKLQWLKINDRTKLHTKCADKYAVRDYIKDKIGAQYLIPLLYQTKNHRNITAINLPSAPFVIKTNHDSGSAVIVKSKDTINWAENGNIKISKRVLLLKNYCLMKIMKSQKIINFTVLMAV